MSVHISSAVWRQSKATGATLLVLLSLADQANDEGICWPSVPMIAERCRVSVRSVSRYLAQLEELGEISRMDRQGRSTVFTVNFTPAKLAPTPAKLAVVDKNSGIAEPLSDWHPPLPTVSPTPANLSPTPATVGVQKRQEPSKEPSRNQNSSLDNIASFDEFWKVYPNKGSRKTALAAYVKALKIAKPEVLLAGAHEARRAWGAPEHRPYAPLGATWLNAERWEETAETMNYRIVSHVGSRKQQVLNHTMTAAMQRAIERDEAAEQRAINQ